LPRFGKNMKAHVGGYAASAKPCTEDGTIAVLRSGQRPEGRVPARGDNMRLARKAVSSSALFVAWCAPVVMLSPNAILVLWTLSGAATALAFTLNDLKHRIIPFWLCALMATVGALKQLALNGPTAALETLAAAAVATAFAFLARWMLIKASGAENVVGGGDCAAAGAVTGYLWMPATAQMPLMMGLMAACAAAIVFVGIMMATKRWPKGTLVPFGPFFYVWALVGTWVTAFAAANTVF